MKEKDLKHKLQQTFDFSIWKEILPLFFKKIDYFSQPENLFTTNENIIESKQVGTVKLDDGKQLAIFLVEVSDNINIVRNRQGLREIAAKYIDQNIIHGALAFFYNRKQVDYRFSFIAKEASLDLETGELIKGETKPKRYTYLLGANEACTTAAKRMLVLADKKEKGEVSIKELKEVFSVEALNKDFFKTYKAHYEKFAKYLADEENPLRENLIDKEKDTKDKQEKPIRDFVKKLLGRIVFLQFLEKKGWMGCDASSKEWTGGNPRFMFQLFEDFSEPERFHSQCLTKLFFETLNTKRPNDIFEIKGLNGKLNGSRVPYLNGGLFEPEKNKATLAIDFPADYFKELLEFFDQYNFTIDENSPDDHEVGIDPEMLGHIFENLLEDNRDKGAFYTPKEIVQYMCKESLIQYLLNTFQEQKDIEQFIRLHIVSPFLAEKENAILLNQKLDDIKVCDPAIGSGAFPIGMLQEIFEAKRFIYPHLKTNEPFNPAEVKKNIIQNSIYGVDLEKGAVDIAQLRFWLSLVVDEINPHPLPNLDYKIMQGNSLLEQYEGIELGNVALFQEPEVTIYQLNMFEEPKSDYGLSKEKQADIKSLIDNYFKVENKEEKTTIHKTIDNIVIEHIDKSLELFENKLLIEIATYEKQLNRKLEMLTENQKQQFLNKSKELKEIEKRKKQLDSKNAARKRLLEFEKTDERPYFLWHLYFKDVFDQGGFDVMIGNPPYVDYRKIDNNITHNLTYKNTNYKSSRPNLYLYFIELADSLLKEKGVLAFINPNQFLSTDAGYGIRQLFINERTVISFNDVSYIDVFKEASTYTTVWFSKKSKCTNDHRIIINRCKNLSDLGQITFFSPIKEIRQSSKLLIPISDEYTLISRIESNHRKLKSICKLNWGTSKSGYGKLKIKKEVYEELEPSLKKQYERIIQTADIKKYTINWKGEYIPKDIFSEKATETFIIDKICIGRLTKNIQASFDDQKYYVGKSTVLTNSDLELKLLLCILNSSIANFWYYSKFESTHMAGGYIRYDIPYLEQLPIPNIEKTKTKPFETLAEYLIYLNDPKQAPVLEKASNEAVSQVFEDLVNMMVYELYFEEEMKAKEIDVLQFVTEKAFPDITQAEDPKAIIQKVYYELQQKDNPIRNRILVASSRSETIARINAATS